MKKNLTSSDKKNKNSLNSSRKNPEVPLDVKNFAELKPKIDHTYVTGKLNKFDLNGEKIKKELSKKD